MMTHYGNGKITLFTAGVLKIKNQMEPAIIYSETD